MYVTVAKHLSG